MKYLQLKFTVIKTFCPILYFKKPFSQLVKSQHVFWLRVSLFFYVEGIKIIFKKKEEESWEDGSVNATS